MADCKLPEDLMICILTLLPVKSLCRFKCVCKPWLSLFSSSEFVANHREITASNPENFSLATFTLCHRHEYVFSFFNANSSIRQVIKVMERFRKLELVGCYNGLVALFCRHYRDVILWNPATCQWKVLCCPDGLQIAKSDRYSVGLGFDSATNDFKVLSILCPNQCDLEVKANVYSANRDCWEKLEPGLKFWVADEASEAIISGVPYWSGLVNDPDLGDDENGFSKGFVRYDVKNGVFDHIPAPKFDFESVPFTTCCLVEWENNCVVTVAIVLHSPDQKENNVVGVMIFDECEGEWSTKFSINIGIPIARQILLFDGTYILVETPERNIFFFDPKTNRANKLCTRSAYQFEFYAFNYIESLVHLKGMKTLTVNDLIGRIQLEAL